MCGGEEKKEGRKEASEIIFCPQSSARLHQEGTSDANKGQFISSRAFLFVLILLCSITPVNGAR